MPDFIDTFIGPTLKPEWASIGSPTQVVDGQLHLRLSGPYDYSGMRYPSDAYSTTFLYSDEFIAGTFRNGYVGFTITLPAVRPASTGFELSIVETNRSAFSNQADAGLQGIILTIKPKVGAPAIWSLNLTSWMGGATLAAESHDVDPAKPHYLISETPDRSLVISRSADGSTYENVTTYSPAPWMGFPGFAAGQPAATDIRLETYVVNGLDAPAISPYEYLIDNLVFHYTSPFNEVVRSASARWNNLRYDLAGWQNGGAARFSPVSR